MDRFAPIILNAEQRDIILSIRPVQAPPSLQSAASQATSVDDASGGMVDAGRAFLGEDSRSTIMIKRIPRKLTCPDLHHLLDSINGMQGSYNFLHIPWDHNRQTSRGFAFVNFISSLHVGILADALNTGSVQDALKNCELRYARIQGTAESLHLLVTADQREFLSNSLFVGS